VRMQLLGMGVFLFKGKSIARKLLFNKSFLKQDCTDKIAKTSTEKR